ncbi:DUF6701 domain-containing protein [Vibrio fortis]|uniref:DUF6701 domain-containing protein n=1 Tax=Vibrio fortis TaxID=212667 RepID=UPI0036F29899
MIKQFFVLILVLFLSALAQANVNTNPQFEFGTIPADKCIVQGPAVTCDIEFENFYSSPPLVFVMPTINASSSNFATKTTEYPSGLRVWSVSSSKAVIKQRVAPNAKACVRLKYKQNNKGEWLWQCVKNTSGELVNYIDAPMENIDYLVIEPGVFEFDNGAKIVAGSFSTKKTISGRDNKGSGTTIDFNSYGLSSNFSSAPGVLVQLQSKENSVNGDPLWLTATAKNPSSSSVTIMLDRSEVTNNADLAKPEDVAFVAGLGEGFVQGRKFWLGQGSTQNTLTLDDKVIKPVTEGCKQFVHFSGVNFNKAPTLIASKSARNGPNGGWLRRCSVTKNGVSFIVEEDMNKDTERSHTLEPFSYFLFDKPPTSGTCALFPSPAQTWTSNNQASVTIANTANISGAPISGGKRYIGFKSNEIVDSKNQGCDGGQCFGDEGLKVEKQQLESFQSPDPGLSTVVVERNQTRTFQNDESIGTLTINKKAKVIFKTGKYWVNSININGSIEIPPGNVVEIHTKGFSISNGAHFSAVDSGELTVFVHDLIHNDNAIYDWVNLSNSSTFVGLLYSEKSVVLSNNATVEGAVTAKTVTLHNGSKIVATNKCFDPADDYDITMTPESDYSLMCGTDQPVFTIKTTNNSEPESLPVTASILPASDADNFTVTVHDGVGSGAYPNFNSSGFSATIGELQLKITVNSISKIDLSQTYTLVITMDDDPARSDSSTIKYVPFKFAVDDQSVIAGKEYDVTAKVLACNNSGTTVVTSYAGTPTITHTLNQPISGVDGALGYSPVFSGDDEGITQDTFSISESGLFTVKLTDSSFDCTGISGCPIDGNGQLTGSFDVASRPWKFAVCTDSDSSGTSSSGNGFAAAGEEFDVYAKPIRYTDGATICNDALVTENYLKSNASVAITHTLDTPIDDGSVLGSLNPNSELTKNATSIVEANKGYKFESLKYSEAGSFNFIATETGSFYGNILGGFSGSKAIGRFYPKYFRVIDQNWNYAGAQSFNYMNQNFEQVSFDVEALSKEVSINGKTEAPQPVHNYQYFDSKLQTSFSLYESELATRFISPSFGNGVWNGSNQSIGHFSTSLSGDCRGSSSFCVTKADTTVGYEDGPYNLNEGVSGDITDIRLAIEDNIDPVEFWSGGDQLLKEPDIRFGRIDLDDVGGSSGAIIAIPLRAEYWNGSQFVVNEDDRTTNVAASTSASSVIWSGDDSTTTTATLKNGGVVTDGESRNLTASQGEGVSTREQVQLWQSMNLTPWLRYNWDSDEVSDDANGEQDPSTVVTFGIYRGNDRVIYRGESGLTGQR